MKCRACNQDRHRFANIHGREVCTDCAYFWRSTDLNDLRLDIKSLFEAMEVRKVFKEWPALEHLANKIRRKL